MLPSVRHKLNTVDMSNKTKSKELETTYLKFGVGNPWAGHIKAILASIGYFSFIEKTCDSIENAGALDPTGSIQEH